MTSELKGPVVAVYMYNRSVPKDGREGLADRFSVR